MIEYNPRSKLIGFPNPNCPKCSGSGRRILSRPGRPQASEECRCIFQSRIFQNIRATWGYMGSPRIRGVNESPLLEYVKKREFLRVTARQDVLAAHLKSVMIHHCLDTDKSDWWVEVTSDKEIVHAWLYTAKMQGIEIADADLASIQLDADAARTVKDLALRADLMVIQVGKKHAANKDTKTTIREALDYRIDLDKPVWIVDTPRDNLDNADLLAYSQELMEDLADYHFLHVDLSNEKVAIRGRKQATFDLDGDEVDDITHEQQLPRTRSPRASLSAGSGGTKAMASAADLQAEEERKQKEKRQKQYGKKKTTTKRGDKK